MYPETTSRPVLGQGAVGGQVVMGRPKPAGANHMLPRTTRAVKSQVLADQAAAAEQKALALAGWHRERAGRYLAWSDLPWCAAQFDHHLAEAAFQERLAARHRAVLAALEGGQP